MARTGKFGRALLVVSLGLNALTIGGGALYLNHKGGLGFFLRKVGLEKTQVALLPFQQDREKFQAALPIGPQDSVFLGDSITAEAPVPAYFTHIQMRGIGSETTAAIKARLGTILKGKPAKLFLMAGTNDLCQDVPLSQTVENVSEILDQIALKSPGTEVYVMSVPPMNQSVRKFEYDPTPRIPDLNRQLELLCKQQHVTFINNEPSLADENGQLRPDCTVDGIHLNATGYARLMPLLAPFSPGEPASPTP